MFIKLSKLDEELMYFYLLGGVESTTTLEENEKKIVRLCAKIVWAATAHFSRAPPRPAPPPATSHLPLALLLNSN